MKQRDRLHELNKQISKLMLERARLRRELEMESHEGFKAPRYDDVFFEGVAWLDSLSEDS